MTSKSTVIVVKYMIYMELIRRIDILQLQFHNMRIQTVKRQVKRQEYSFRKTAYMKRGFIL